MSYIYFANYNENKIEKQRNQVIRNMKTLVMKKSGGSGGTNPK